MRGRPGAGTQHGKEQLIGRLGNQRGQAALLYTLTIVLLFGLLGLVVDLGWMYFREQSALAAAEAAAMAAATAADQFSAGSPACGSNNVVCQAATACANPIPNPANNNLASGCLYAQQNGFQAGGNQNVLLAANTTTPPVAGLTVAYWVTATVSESLPATFARVVGARLTTVSARATAAVMPSGGGGCIYVLDPTATAVINNGNASLQSGCGVYINSNNNTAVNLNGNAYIKATNGASVNIVGNWNGNGNAYISPTPKLGGLPTPDPFSSIAEPPDPGGSCQSVSYSGKGSYTLNPGDYCSFSLTGQVSVTLNPGIYVLKNGLSMAGQTSISGSGVVLYNKSGSISMAGGTTSTLSGPGSGTYEGFTIFQSRSNGASMDLAGGSSQSIDGVVYVPGAQLTYSGNGNANGSDTTIVVNRLIFSGNAYIKASATTQLGGPTGGVALIQ